MNYFYTWFIHYTWFMSHLNLYVIYFGIDSLITLDSRVTHFHMRLLTYDYIHLTWFILQMIHDSWITYYSLFIIHFFCIFVFYFNYTWSTILLFMCFLCTIQFYVICFTWLTIFLKFFFVIQIVQVIFPTSCFYMFYLFWCDSFYTLFIYLYD